jgi:hypothetical protein
MTIATYIIGYFILCLAVGAVIIFANFMTAIVTLGFAIAAVVVVIVKPVRTVRHG